MITYEDFKRMDIKLGVIKEVSIHPNADKLYVLKVDIGQEQRQLVAGIRGYYSQDELGGRHIVVLANLEPKKVRGLVSEGMLLAACDDEGLSMLTVDKPRKCGSKVQ